MGLVVWQPNSESWLYHLLFGLERELFNSSEVCVICTMGIMISMPVLLGDLYETVNSCEVLSSGLNVISNQKLAAFIFFPTRCWLMPSILTLELRLAGCSDSFQ